MSRYDCGEPVILLIFRQLHSGHRGLVPCGRRTGYPYRRSNREAAWRRT